MDEKSPKNNKNLKPRNTFIRFASAGLQIGVTIWLGNEFGKWLDVKYNKDFLEPTVTLIAIFISIYLIIAQVIKISK